MIYTADVIFETAVVWELRSLQIAFSLIVVEKPIVVGKILLLFIHVHACLKLISHQDLFLLS